MIFYTMDNDTVDIKFPHKMEGFYLSLACIENGKLVKHQCNHQNWSKHYIQLYKDNPITNKLLLSPCGDGKLRIMEWCGGINQNEGNVASDFFEERARILQSSHGYIAYKACQMKDALQTVMYTIAAYDEDADAQKLLLDPLFMKQIFSVLIKILK